MKNLKFALFLLISFIPNCLVAKQVSQGTAKQIAEAQLQLKNQLRSVQELNLVFTRTTGSETVNAPKKVSGNISFQANSNAPADVLYYVFSAGGKGFVIVSGDDIAKPVLGYSDADAFDPNNLPPDFVYYMDDCLAKEIEQAIIQGTAQSEDTKEQWDAFLNKNSATLRASGTVVNPLIQTQWNQTAPYNALCPSGTVTGCVATAMAQVMKYWNYPATGTDSYSYIDPTYGAQSANFGNTNYDWANMTNTYSSYSLPQENSAVATLMYHCGVSVKMQYGTAASGGSSALISAVVSALVKYFKYDAGITYLERNYYSYTDWLNILKPELDAGRPIYYGGQGSAGGHAFVCDGYDSDNLFHFNWGWGGSSNGYFELSALSPETLGVGGGAGGYNTSQTIVVGIQPDAGGSSASNILFGLSDFYPSTATSLSSVSVPFDVTIVNLTNLGSTTLSSMYLNMQLYKDDGSLIGYLSPSSYNSYNITNGLPPSYYFSSITISNRSLPSGLASGTYRIYAVFSPTSSPLVPNKIKGVNGDKYIRVVVASDNTVLLTKASDTAPVLSLESLTAVGNLYQSRTGKFIATVANSGNGDYYSQMSLQLNGAAIVTDPVVIPAGSTKEVVFSSTNVISLSPDDYSLSLWYDPDNNQSAPSQQLGSNQTVTVLATPSDPVLSVTNFSFPNANSVPVNEPNLSVTVRNTGGIFDGRIIVYITARVPNGGSYSIIGSFGTKNATIDQRNAQTIIFNDPVSLPAGDYYGWVFSSDGVTSKQISNNYSFTLTSAPVVLPVTTLTWLGKTSDWNVSTNWSAGRTPIPTDTVIIAANAPNFPDLQNNVAVAAIRFEPGAQIGRQSKLTGKVFVQYDLNNRDKWLMLSMPLGEAYPDDFTFGGYPQTWVCSFSSEDSGTIVYGSWSAFNKIQDPFKLGDGFIVKLNRDDEEGYPTDTDKGLKLLNGIRELPFFQHHAEGSSDSAFYSKVHQAHDYSSGVSTFYSIVNNSDGNGYVRNKDDSYTVPRDESAYQLAGASVSKTLNFTGDNFALTGNPYMAVLDLDNLYQNNSNVINGYYYVWIDGSYKSYSSALGESFGDVTTPLGNYIAPLQGFLVGKSGTASEQVNPLVFNENMTTVNSDIHLRSSAGNENKLIIDAHNSTAKVRTIIAKREGGQNEFGNMDARTIINSINNVPEIYTLKSYQGGLIAVGANVVNSDDLLIPIGLATSYTGNITLSFSGMDAYDAKLSFIDTEANKEIDLTGLASYDYEINYTPKIVNGAAAVYEDRFFIRISKTIAGLNGTAVEKANAYEANGRIQVVSGASNPIKEVMVYNQQGALIYKKSAINAISHTVDRSLHAGAYIVKVISEKNTDNVKVIVK